MAEEKKVVTKKTTAKAASTEPATPKRPVDLKDAPASAQKKTSVKKAPLSNPAGADPAPDPAPDPGAAAGRASVSKAAAPATSVQAPLVEDRAVSLPPLGAVTAEQRWRMIADAAYYRAEKRNFAAGYQEADWLAAEAEVDAVLQEHAAGSPQAPAASADDEADPA